MTNEEKSKEIANNNCSHPCCSHGEHYFTSESDCYNAAMEMAAWKDEQCCANCKHLNIPNGITLYAWCTKWGWNFMSFQADTRTTRCGQYEEKKGSGTE